MTLTLTDVQLEQLTEGYANIARGGNNNDDVRVVVTAYLVYFVDSS